MQHTIRFFVLTTLAAALAAIPARAEEGAKPARPPVQPKAAADDATGNVALSPVVVSAARLEQSTLEAPASVSVIGSDQLDASGAARVGEALTAKTPGFYMRGGGTLGSDSRINGAMVYSLRGQSQNRVKIMVDGLNLSDGSSGSVGSLSGIQMGDVERIEVVPGVSSALYGSDAIGGVINVISKTPTKQEFFARYTQGFDDGERRVFSAAYRDRWQSGLAASLSFTREDYSGYADNSLVVLPVSGAGNGKSVLTGGRATTTNTGAPAYIVGNQGPLPGGQTLGNARLYYHLDAQSKFYAGISHIDSKTRYRPFNVDIARANGQALVFPLANAAIDGKRLGTINESSFWNSSNPNLSRETRYVAGYDGKLGKDYDLKVNIGYFDRDGYYVSPGTTAATWFDGGPGANTTTPNTTLDASAQIGTALGERHYLIAGVSRNSAQLRRKVYATSNWRQPETSRSRVNEWSNGDSRTDALFFQDQIFLTPALTVYVGGRFDRWTTRGVAQKNVGAPIGRFVSPERSQSAFSPKVSAVYRLDQRTTVRGSLGTAFRAPSNYDLYTTPTKMGNRLLIADSTLKPEKAQAWDIGIEHALSEQGFLKAAYYETVLNDMIYRKTQPYTGSMIGIVTEATMTNAGESKVRGIELSGEIALTGWLRGIASYTYTDAKITRDDSGAGLEGKRLRYVPKNTAHLALDGQWGPWRAYLSTRYTGLQYSNEDNSDVVKGVYGGTSQYWLTHLRVSHAFDKRFKASVGVNNLFDKKYYENYLMPGRNAYLELSATF